MWLLRSTRAEAVTALILAVLGVVLTTWGAITHLASLIAPGATLILVGASWFGNALARQDVRLFSSSVGSESGATEQKSALPDSGSAEG
jgi:hypothetical protein